MDFNPYIDYNADTKAKVIIVGHGASSNQLLKKIIDHMRAKEVDTDERTDNQNVKELPKL